MSRGFLDPGMRQLLKCRVFQHDLDLLESGNVEVTRIVCHSGLRFYVGAFFSWVHQANILDVKDRGPNTLMKRAESPCGVIFRLSLLETVIHYLKGALMLNLEDLTCNAGI